MYVRHVWHDGDVDLGALDDFARSIKPELLDPNEQIELIIALDTVWRYGAAMRRLERLDEARAA